MHALMGNYLYTFPATWDIFRIIWRNCALFVKIFNLTPMDYGLSSEKMLVNMSIYIWYIYIFLIMIKYRVFINMCVFP